MILLVLFLPWLLQKCSNKVAVLKQLGSVFLCYAVGIMLSFPLKAMGADLTLASDASSVLVCIAMPLVLFSANIPALRRLAKPMLISFALNVVAVLAVAVASFFLFDNIVPHAEKISGMLVGTYTGGTPNMFAIGHGLSASSEQMVLLQTSDMIGGGIYFFLLLSVLPGFLKKFMPEYRFGTEAANCVEGTDAAIQDGKTSIKNYVCILLLAVLCVAVAMGVCLALPSRFGNAGLAKLSEHTAVIMLIVTTLGIGLSFVKKIRSAPGSYSVGQYFILMFSVAMGFCFDINAITKSALFLFCMLMVIQFGTVIVHFVLARMFRIDYHTTMITSTAGVFGPAFIIPVANKLKNDEIILPGILCGILGYAIGNYLGIGVGELLARPF